MRTNSSAAANYMDYDSSSSMPGAFDLGREVQRAYEDLADAASRCGRRACLLALLVGGWVCMYMYTLILVMGKTLHDRVHGLAFRVIDHGLLTTYSSTLHNPPNPPTARWTP